MKTQQALEPQMPKAPETLQPEMPAKNKPLFVEAEHLFEHMRELTQAVAHRAYEFFEQRGYRMGHELDDWFKAESELTRNVPLELTENEKEFTVKAEVPGFKAEEIKISVEPDCLLFSGQKNTEMEEQKEGTIYNERRSQRFCRTLNLPANIDTNNVVATLKDGVLHLTMPKTQAPTTVDIAIKSE